MCHSCAVLGLSSTGITGPVVAGIACVLFCDVLHRHVFWADSLAGDL